MFDKLKQLSKDTAVYGLSTIVGRFLNFLLIPSHGIIGAALATLITNTFYTAVLTYYSFKEFAFPIYYQPIILYFLSGAAMYWLIGLFDCGSLAGTIIVKIGLGGAFYAGTALLWDREIRKFVHRRFFSLKGHS